MLVGPVLVAPCAVIDQLAERLQADEARSWAACALHTQVDFGTLERHLAALCYLHTHDGQRYFLRYADSRSLVALWPVLSTSQQGALLGPVQRWVYTDRQAQRKAISLNNDASSNTATRPATQLRLSNQQLGGLLEATWPDQLLCSVSEKQPDIGRSLTPWQRYACAQRVCDWLLAEQEERYPVQLDMLKRILLKASPDWDEAKWLAALKMSHQAGVEACA